MASREEIRSAALPLFAKQGVAQTTAAQIAEAAGVAEGEAQGPSLDAMLR